MASTSLSAIKSRRAAALSALPHPVVGALRGHLEKQPREMEVLRDRYGDESLVCTTELGALINPAILRQRSLALLLTRAGLPHMRFHDLIHTCATLLPSKGVHPKFVQELLGHATKAIALDTYSHVLCPAWESRPPAPCRMRSRLWTTHSPSSGRSRRAGNYPGLFFSGVFYLQNVNFFSGRCWI